MKNNPIALAVVVAIVAAGAGFFGGMKYEQSQQPAFFRQATGGQGGNRVQFQRNGQGGTGFRPLSGEIISADEKSITVKMQDGSSKIVFLSDSTQINKADVASREELKAGVTVAVFGTEGTDGTVTAQTIQLNPQQMRIRSDGQAPTDQTNE